MTLDLSACSLWDAGLTYQDNIADFDVVSFDDGLTNIVAQVFE